MAKLEAVIYDMDGLIVDSEPFWRDAEIEVFKTVGLHLSEADCMRTKGMRIDEVVDYWFDKSPWKGPTPEQIVLSIMQKMIELMEQHATALPGVLESLQLLKEKNIKLALASSSQLNLINTVVDTLNIRTFFDVILSAENEEFGKPHPAVFIRAAKQLQVSSMNCLVFEDSLHGVIAGRAANMKVIAIPDPKEIALPAFQVAHAVIHSMEEFSLQHAQNFFEEK